MDENRKKPPSPARTPDKNDERGCIPVTPRMLVKSLENLKDSKILGINFSPEQVAEHIREAYPCVQQDFTILLLEVSDKLSCAASADIVGYKLGVGYFPYNLKQCGARLDSRSELTFWVLYKRILDQRRKIKEKSKKRSDSTEKHTVIKKRKMSKKSRKI